MSTVDWSQWGQLTPAEQQALRERYRAIIKDESEHSRRTNYRAMNEALQGRVVDPK